METKMDKIEFSQLNITTRIMVCVSMFMAWVLFAEFIIDRYGIHEYLPFYRFADICPYELVVIGSIVFYWIKTHRK